MNFIFIILLVTVVANLVLGWVSFRNQKNSISNRIFLVITISIALWAIAKILFYTSGAFFVNLIAIPLLYISGISIATSFLIFAAVFPKEKINLAKNFYTVVLTPPVIFALLIIGTNLVVSRLITIGGVRSVSFGDLYPAYIALIVAYFGIGHFYLLKKLIDSSGLLRAQFIYVILGSSISAGIGVFTNVLLPFIGNFKLFWLGPPITIIMVVLFTYSIIKHHLLNARVITTELFTVLLLGIAFIDAALAQSFIEFAERGVIFLFILIFGIMLIRGTLREINELERLSEAKSEFVSIASHQLRTPLSAIKGFISMIKEGSGTEENRKDWLDKAYASNERLIRLVGDLLNISRIERGTLKYNFGDVNVITLVDEVFTEFKKQGEDKGLEMIWEKPSQHVPYLHADKEKLRQVLINLLDNAIKYTQEGHVVVRVLYLRDLKKVKIGVKDSGVGIEEKDLRKLFNLFSRGEGGEKTQAEGVGLGLYIARKIIEAHKGKIWVESDGTGKGSRFIVELPV